MTRNWLSRALLINYQQFFYLEQCAALLIGAICLGMPSWIAFHAHGAFSIGDGSRFAEEARVAMGWSLTIAVALLGITLLRFAFYNPGKPTADIDAAQAPRLAPEGGAREGLRTANLVLRDRGRP